MPTIVEYSERKKPVNAYPARIISPPKPGPCCAEHSERVGDIQQELDGWRYYYKRCRICGFTVRHFLPMSPEMLRDLFRGIAPLLLQEVA